MGYYEPSSWQLNGECVKNARACVDGVLVYLEYGDFRIDLIIFFLMLYEEFLNLSILYTVL